MSTLKVNNVTDLGDDAVITDGALVGAGKILQVVSTTKTDTFVSNNTGFVDVTGLTVSITPSSADSKILVSAMVPWGSSQTGSRTIFTLADGNNNNLIPAASPGVRSPSFFAGEVPSTPSMYSAQLELLHSPNTTSAFTYKIRVRVSGTSNNARVNRADNDPDSGGIGRGVATITAMEVAG